MTRLLVTGSAGFFGDNFCRRHGRRFEILAAWHLRRPMAPVAETYRVDLSDPGAVDRLWVAARPEAVLHLAGRTSIGECERNPEAEAVNTRATAVLAERAAADGVRMLYTSTDLVFDGTAAPYAETDRPTPIMEYGRTKAGGERAVLAAGGRHLVCRVSLAYGPGAEGGVRQLDWMLEQLERGLPVHLFEDEFRSPIDVVTLVDALAELVEADATGCLHLAGSDRVSRLELGRRLLAWRGLDPGAVRAARLAGSGLPRPADATLSIERARRLLETPLIGLENGLERVDRELSRRASGT